MGALRSIAIYKRSFESTEDQEDGQYLVGAGHLGDGSFQAKRLSIGQPGSCGIDRFGRQEDGGGRKDAIDDGR